MTERFRARYKTDARVTTTTSLISGTPVFTPYSQVHFLAKEYETMFDHLTPGFYKKSGVLPQNPLSYVCSTLVEAPSVLYWHDRNNARFRQTSGMVSQFLFGTQGFTKVNVANPSSYSLENMIASAKEQALARFSKPEYAFRETAATALNTLRTIHHPLLAIKRIASRFSKAKRNMPRRLKGDARAVADLWLSYSVNAGPNIQTVQDAIDAYATSEGLRFNLKNSFGVSKYESGRLFSQQSQNAGITGISTAERSISAHVKAGILYTILDAGDNSARLGLKMRHLPGLIWELQPLSFMIDRMYNVKRFIDVAAALNSSKMRVLGGYVVTRVTDRYKRNVKNLAVSGSTPPSPSASPPLYEITYTMNRMKWNPTSFDVLPPLKATGLVDRLHSAADTASLIITNLRR